MGPKILGTLGPRPLREICHSLHVTLPNLVALGQNRMSVDTEICQKKWDPGVRLSRSLKVIRTDTDRSATYDFVVDIHVLNHGSIS